MSRVVILSAVAAIVVSTVAAVGSATATGGNAQAAAAARAGLIAFMRPGKLGEYDIWVVRPNGKGLRRLTTTPRDHSDYNPTWSPDGSTVLFERRGDADGEDLYTVPATGGAPTRFSDCSGDCWSDGEADWSKDGSWIAFGRATGPRSAPGPSLVAIYANASSGEVRQLSHPPKGFEDHYPTWAPDGKTIVVQRDTSTETPGRTKFVSINVEGGSERILYVLPRWAPGAGIPRFSPNGKKILFSFWCIYGDSCPPATRTRRNDSMATIGADGRGLRILPLRLWADSGAWAPSGTRIVYRCRRTRDAANLVFNLCVSRPDGRVSKCSRGSLGQHTRAGAHIRERFEKAGGA